MTPRQALAMAQGWVCSSAQLCGSLSAELPGEPPPPGFTAAWLCEAEIRAKLSTIEGGMGCQDKCVAKWEDAEFHTILTKVGK